MNFLYGRTGFHTTPSAQPNKRPPQCSSPMYGEPSCELIQWNSSENFKLKKKKKKNWVL